MWFFSPQLQNILLKQLPQVPSDSVIVPGCLSPGPSTPSTPSQHTCCHCNQKTNPKAALSAADRIAACHHRPVRSGTYLKEHSMLRCKAVECVADTQTYTGLILESAAVITAAQGYNIVYSKSMHVRWIDENQWLHICLAVKAVFSCLLTLVCQAGVQVYNWHEHNMRSLLFFY